VLALIGDLRRELGDRATVGNTTSRALNLYRQSDVPWEAFVTAVYSARAATQARTSAIRRRDAGGVNKMPYMLTVLADRLGLRETPTAGVWGFACCWLCWRPACSSRCCAWCCTRTGPFFSRAWP